MEEELIAEEIMAEPEEPGFVARSILSSKEILSQAFGLLESNGWYIVGIGALTYYVYHNYIHKTSSSVRSASCLRSSPLGQSQNSASDTSSPQDSARREALQKLQEKYRRDAEEKAKKDAEKEEKKRRERLEELERLDQARFGGGSGTRLGSANRSLRPEYNPLMGNGGSTCSRPTGGRKQARGG